MDLAWKGAVGVARHFLESGGWAAAREQACFAKIEETEGRVVIFGRDEVKQGYGIGD